MRLCTPENSATQKLLLLLLLSYSAYHHQQHHHHYTIVVIIIIIIVTKPTAIYVNSQTTRKQLIAIIIQSCTTQRYRWPHSCMSLASLERHYLPLTVIESLLVRDVPEINTLSIRVPDQRRHLASGLVFLTCDAAEREACALSLIHI